PPPPRPPFLPHVQKAARALPFWPEVEAFRAAGPAYFECPGVPDDSKLRLYRGLVKLRALDQLSPAQHEPKNLDTRACYATFVRSEYERPAPPPSPPSARRVAIFAQPTGWRTGDFDDFAGMLMWNRANRTFCSLFPAVDWPSDDAI